MDGAEESPRSKKQLPSWVVAVAIVVSGGATAWAAWQTGFRGPQLSWQTATQAVSQVWPGQMDATGAMTAPMGAAPMGAAPMQAAPMQAAPMQAAPIQAAPMQAAPTQPGQAQSGSMGAVPMQPVPMQPGPIEAAPAPNTPVQVPPSMDPAARTVAGLPGVPRIISGTPRPHPDRGACTHCHTVLKGDGRPTPNIASFSVRPHEYRGVCSNCHQVVVGGNPVAALQVQPAPLGGWQPQGGAMAQPPMQADMGAFGAMPQAQMGLGQPQGPRAPNEAEWRGMEVRPADQGVVVTKTDGAAGRAGMQPGDVIESVNGQSIGNIADFVGATQNGKLPQGTVIARRSGGRAAFELPASGAPTAGQVFGQMQGMQQMGPVR